MHTIDLLKGQGIPPKTTIKGVFFIALVFILPLLAGSIMAATYAINKINIDMQMIALEKLKSSVEEYSPGRQEAAKIQNEKNYYNIRLKEASKCIDTYFQWSPVLITLVENMPKDMVMDKLLVSNISSTSLKKSQGKDKELVIPVPQKKMIVELSGSGRDTFNMLVQEYQETLKQEESLVPVLKDLTYIKQAVKPNNPEESFKMDFIFDKKKK